VKNKKNSNLIKMTLEGVRIELPSHKPILLLKEENGNRFLISPFKLPLLLPVIFLSKDIF